MIKSITTFVFTLIVWQFCAAQKAQEPVNSGELLSKGINLHDEQDYEGALEFYERIPVNDTNYVVTLYERSMTLLAMKRYADAIEVAREGLKYKGENDSQLFITLGNALDESGKPEEAIKAYTEGIARFPNNNMLYFNRAVTYRKTEKHQECVDDLKESLRLNPMHPGSHLLLGSIALLEKKIVEGMLAINAFLVLEPFTDRARDAVGMLDQLNKEKLEVEPKGIVFSKDGDDFSEIAVLMENRVFANKGFKVPIKLDYYFVKQNYLLFQQLSEHESRYSSGFFSEYYVPFFISVYRSQMFDELTLYQLLTVQAQNVQKMIKKKESTLTKFIPWVIDEFKSKTSHHTIVWDGKEQKMRHWYYKNSHVEAIGNADPTGTKAIGNWQRYNAYGSLEEKSTYDQQGNRQGVALVYYPTGELQREIDYKDGKVNGWMKDYYKNGKLKVKSELQNDEFNGASFLYYLDGTIKEENTYVKGKLEGKAKLYYQTNTLKYEVDYKNGLFEGKIKEYYPDGKVKFEGEYLAGKRTGPSVYYYKNGSIEAKYTYEADQITGPFETFFENGQLQKKGTYKNGILVGKYQSWHENGKISEEEEYDENGKGNGIQKEYAQDGILLFESEIKKDALLWYKFYDKSGKVIAEGKEEKGKLNYRGHYDTGEIYVNGEYVKGKKDGVWKYYTKLGVPTLEESYKDGELFQVRRLFTSGTTKELTRYKDGVKEGAYESYFYNGKVNATGWYSKGEPNGYWHYYRADGTKSSSSYYILGTRYGPQLDYSLSGKLSSEIVADIDGRDIRCMYYDTAGKVNDDIDFSTTTGELAVHHQNGKLLSSSHYKNDWAHGKFTWYYFNGSLKAEGNYEHNLKNGKFLGYFLNGKQEYEGAYLDGEKDGVWKYYYVSGKLRETELFENGYRKGESIEYYESGQIKSKKNYKDGYRSGASYYYNEDGQLRLVKNFEYNSMTGYSYLLPDGKMSPEVKLTKDRITVVGYFKNGKKSEEFVVDRGVLEGAYLVYHSNGNLQEKSEFRGGLQEGVEETFYSNGKIRSSKNFLNDELHGLAIYYDAAGNVEKELMFQHGELHGLCRYFEQGKLVKTRIYFDDVIVSEEPAK